MKFRELLFIILIINISGCHNSIVKRAGSEEHEEESVKFQYTGYSAEFEVFAEADPFVAGEPANILAHFTWLSDFKPIDSAEVTVNLSADGKSASQKLQKPSRRGIYSFDIKPETAGKGKLVFEIVAGGKNFMLEVSPVDVYPDEETAHSEAEKNAISSSNAFVFTKEQSWKVDFSTNDLEIKPFGQVIKTVALIQPSLTDEKIITAAMRGIILFSGNNVLEGRKVQAGIPLFSVSGTGFAENNSSVYYLEARNNYLKTKADYERQLDLASDKIVSEKELLETKNVYENARARYEMISKNFNQAGQQVSSTVSGFIKEVYVVNGQYVETGQAVVSVSSNSSLLLKADIPQKYSSVASKIVTAVIKSPVTGETFTLEQLNGKFLSRGRNTNPDNYLIPISLQIEGREEFIPGGFAEVWLKTQTDEQVLVVPNSSLIEEQGNFFVFVQVTPELFEKREVKTGATDGLFSQISEGLNSGERIVTKGAMMVKLAQASGTLDPHAGHVH